ncbi:MAG: transaldolase family protein [Candidatus Latescibacterota bacterium]
MKIWVDSADIEFVRQAASTGTVYGITTYPPAVVEECGGDFVRRIQELLEVVPGPVCGQAVSTDTDGIVAEGRALAKLGDRVHVKIPCDAAGITAMSRLTGEGINVAATAVNSLNKAICAIEAGVNYLMPYTAYLDSINIDGAALVSEIRHIIDLGDRDVEIVSCVDTPEQLAASALAGAHAVTIVPSGFWGLMKHEPTEAAVAGFLQIWRDHYGTQNWVTGFTA